MAVTTINLLIDHRGGNRNDRIITSSHSVGTVDQNQIAAEVVCRPGWIEAHRHRAEMLLATYLYILCSIILSLTPLLCLRQIYIRSDTLCASVISQGQSKKGCGWRQKS